MQNWKIWTTKTFRGYCDYPLNVSTEELILM